MELRQTRLTWMQDLHVYHVAKQFLFCSATAGEAKTPLFIMML